MEDYLSEKEQWEAVKAWLRANLPWILGGIALGGVALGGYRWWQQRTSTEGLDASARYEKIIAAFDKGDRSSAITAIGELERDHPGTPYVDQAHLAEARMAVAAGQLDKAAESLRSVMEKSKDPQLATVARLRLARVQLAQNKLTDALATLDGATPGAFEPRFQEVRGDIRLAQGDKGAALKEYRAARVGAAPGVIETAQLDLKINDLSDAPVEK